MAAARIALVLGIVTLDANEGRLAIAAHFEAQPARPDVLVVVFEPGGEIVAEAPARQPRERATDANEIADRGGSGDHAFRLIVGAVSRANLDRGVLRQSPGDVFYRAADRVAAVERALRAAQHLDPLDVVDVEHRGLRAVEIDIIQIDADALFEARHRILLTDTADEGGERRIGGAAGLERDVGHGLPDIGDVERAPLCQFLAADCRNRDGHIDQPFLTPACGNDDHIVVRRGCRFGSLFRNGLRLRGCRSKHGSGDAAQQASGHDSG